MITNTKIKFCFELGALLLALVFTSTTVLSEQKPIEPCKSTIKTSCVIVCRDWDLESQNGVVELTKILKEKKHQTCTLIFDHCTYKPNHWKTIPKNHITNLKIFHSGIDINKLNLKIFQNVQRLTITNTTMETLTPEVFLQLPHLKRLRIRNNKFLKTAKSGFLQNLTLEYVQIQNVHLNQSETFKFFQNLTSGGSEIKTVRTLDWSFNNFGNFSKKLLESFPNLEILILNNSNISGFDDGVFDFGDFRKVYAVGNQIQTVREQVFGRLAEKGTFVSLKQNPIVCECVTKWSESIQVDCPELRKSGKVFTMTNTEPENVEIVLPDMTNLTQAYIWYIDYENTTSPQYKCIKITNSNFSIKVKPNVNYIICITYTKQKIYLPDCRPLKTAQNYKDEPLLTKKSIPLLIISILFVFVFGLSTGALILYLSVRKNPSLIRGSKRVIEVKRHDKAQILIMPRGYESVVPATPRLPIEPASSFDTISTVSYVSANQPTQLEILTYRFNRLRELFQRNSVSSLFLPSQMMTPMRLPPNVDLLLEYEWYTITTTTTTTTTTEV